MSSARLQTAFYCVVVWMLGVERGLSSPGSEQLVFGQRALNKLLFGLSYYPTSPNRVEIKIKNATTNYVGAYNSSLYLNGLRGYIRLVDNQGKEVKKTQKGVEVERPLSEVKLNFRNQRN